MPLRSASKRYINLPSSGNHEHEETPWYWRLIAMIASWMILGGYLILPALYNIDPKLKFNSAVLSVFVVALLTAGYSFTALLCFACRSEQFQAQSIFLPALTSSAFGLLTIAYNFLSSRLYTWNTPAISGTVIATASTVVYGALLLWTHRRIVKLKEKLPSRSANLWSEQRFYNNFLQNMYPTAVRSNSQPPEAPLTEDDRIKQQMALLLMKSDPGPSPDASSATFRIDMPEDEEEQRRIANSSELLGTPPSTTADYRNRDRANSRPDSLSADMALDNWMDRGRTQNRPSSVGGRSNHSRNVSREERRREIEMGIV